MAPEYSKNTGLRALYALTCPYASGYDSRRTGPLTATLIFPGRRTPTLKPTDGLKGLALRKSVGKPAKDLEQWIGFSKDIVPSFDFWVSIPGIL